MRRNILYLFTFVYVLLMSACSNSDYLNAIPSNSVALVSLDLGKKTGFDNQTLLKAFLHVVNANTAGVDVSSPLYLFESADGNLGLCAKVNSVDDLQKTLEGLSSKGVCQAIKEHKDFHFTFLQNAWVVGYSDDALLVMGPTTAANYASLRNQMVKYLRQSEEKSILTSRLYAHLDSIEGAMKMVARVDALPEKLAMPFALGAPKGTEPSQVFVSAQMNVEGNCLVIDGKTFSFKPSVDKAIKEAMQTYRLLDGKHMFTMAKHDVYGLFVNVNGNEFIRLLNENNGFQALLAGVNTAIDMDNIIKSVDGDMCVIMSNMDNNTHMKMSAQLAHSKWLDDVSYWKQSCPRGATIRDWGTNAYCYSDGKTSYYFGVSPDLQFYSGSSENDARMALKPSSNPAMHSLIHLMDNQKLVMVMNLQALDNNKEEGGGFSQLLKPLFGEVHSVVYRLKE